MLDDFDLDTLEEEDGGEESSSSGENRTFVVVAGGLGVLMLIALAFMAIYALVILPRQRAGDQAVAATETTIVQQEAAARALTETALAQAQVTDTPTATKLPTSTEEPVAAAEEAEAEADEPIFTPGGPTADPRTATVQALLTSAAAAQTQAASSLNTVTPTSTLISALPEAGFLDDTGAPALVGIAVLLVLVIMMARRLRQANT
jgi:hypothetical protein